MEDFTIIYNRWQGENDISNYIFTNKKTSNLKEQHTVINHVISRFDTVSQVMKKIYVYVCENALKLSVSLSDLYLWIDDNNSPFIENGKKSNICDSKYEHDLINIFLNNSNEIKFTLTSHLEKRLEKSKTVAKWVESWVANNASKTSKMDKSQIENIKEHTNFITKVESTKIPKKTLQIKRTRHTMIFTDLVLSKETKKDGLDIDKIFKQFPLNNNVPLIKIGTKTNSKTKVYKPAIKRELDTKFWKKWQKEDDKEQNLQIKFMYEFCTIQITIYNNSSISVRCSGEITKELWKMVYEKILEWIILPINNIVQYELKPLKFEKLKYRLINSKTLIKKNVNLKPSIINDFIEYVPYFSLSNEQKLRFIKVTDYQRNRITIANEIYNFYRDNEKTVKRLGILFMISDNEANNELDILNNDKLVRNSNNDMRLLDDSSLGYSIKITYDSEYIKIIHTGKNPEEIDYAINTIRKLLFIHSINTNNSKQDKPVIIDSDDDSDDDIDALIANVDDSDDSDSSDDSDDDNVPILKSDSDSESESESESEPESDLEDENKDNSWYSLSTTRRPKIPPKDVKTIRFSLPPAGWNTKKDKAGNIRTYRSERLKFYDPDLFNMKFSETGKEVSRKDGKVEFSTSCAPTQSHPIAFNHAEHDRLLEILKEYVDNGHPEIKDKPRILDWLEYRNVWYLASECICVGCMLPLRLDELGKNEECPKCNSNKYTIRNDNSSTGNKIKLGPAKYNLSVWPCRRIRDQPSNQKKAPDSSTYILGKDRFNIEKGRLGDLPDAMHKMFGNATDISKGPIPKSGNPYILRYGIYEKSFDDSFIKAISVLYGKNENQVIDSVINNLKDVTQFIRTCEGSLINLFSAKRNNDTNDSDYKKWLKEQTFKGSISSKHMQNIYNSYANFCDFLKDKSIEHDHRIMWPILCYPGVLWKYGLNLYLFKTDKKTGNRVEYICPPNGHPFYYHYTEEFVNSKTAFLLFSTMYDGRYFYEPCAKFIPSDKKRKEPQLLFDSLQSPSNTNKDGLSTAAWNSVAPLRQHCGTSLQDNYVSYLRKNNYKLNPLPYTSNYSYLSDYFIDLNAKKILHKLELKPIAQVMNSKYQSNGLVVLYQTVKFFIPIEPRSVILDLDILEKIPCSNIPDFNLAYKFYTWLSKNKMRTKPLEYIVDLKTNKINGIILETNNVIPIKPSSLSQDNNGLNKSIRPTYECDEDIDVIDTRETYISEFNDYWYGYDEFCMNVAKNIKKSQSKLDDKDIQKSKDIIKLYSKSLVIDDITKNYLDTLLKEYEYNYVRRNDIKTGKKPLFITQLENNKIVPDTKIFDDNESKEYYIKNQKNQSTYAKYIPFYNPDNLDILKDSKLYSMSNIGLKLSKTWQKILHKDFRYAHYDKYVWIDKITHISIYDLLKELQNDRKWIEISRQTNSCIVILDNKGSAITYGNNKRSRFYLLFYSIESDIYPIFLTKNSNQEFDMSSADLSTEFIEIIGGDCPKNIEDKPKDDKPKEKKPKNDKSKEVYCKLSDTNVRRRCTKTKLKSEDSDECLYDNKTNYCRIKK